MIPIIPNVKSFFSTGRWYATQTGDSRQEGNGPTPDRRRSASIKALSRYALRHKLMIAAFYIVRLYFLTIRIESVNEDAIRQHLESGNKMIAVLWHQRIIAVIGYAKRFGSYRPSVIISRSRDGDKGIPARIAFPSPTDI